MSDAPFPARAPISCPECGVLMEAGWAQVPASLEDGGGELRWTNQAPEEGSGRVRVRDGRVVLPLSTTCWGCWCENCRNLYLRTEVSPTDAPDEEYAWVGIACLRCEAMIPPGEERCVACGWSHEVDGPAPDDTA